MEKATTVFLPGEFHGEWSLVGYSPWCHKELDITNTNRLNGETDIENRLRDMGSGEKRVRCMERVTWKLALPYIKYIANGSLLSDSGNSNRCSVPT